MTVEQTNGKPKGKKSKRALRRAKAKAKKRMLQVQETEIRRRIYQATAKDARRAKDEDQAVIEFVAPKDLEMANPAVELAFRSIFRKFATPEQLVRKVEEKKDKKEKKEEDDADEEHKKEEDTAVVAEEEDPDRQLSRRERKLRSRLSIAELKQLVAKPDVVEIHDCNSADPKLLVHLKSYPNTVPVPSHWCQRRAYLQGKKGYEKPPFELPPFIAATGITDIRQHQSEKEGKQSNKQAQRSKVQPKMNKIDIDYQVLHDAFFRHQTLPELTSHGNIYYEGKEFEMKLKCLLPGKLSAELRRALGMADETSPPPWLPNMQRFGPPPSWPKLKIPGINTPIPPGARYGVGPGEWGKPPVDDYGVPLYGDVFGTAKTDEESVEVDKELWGLMQEEDDLSEDEDEDEDNEDEDEEDMESDMDSALESESSATSGISTPISAPLNPRKTKDGTGTETPEGVRAPPPALYKVLKQKEASVGEGAVFGSQHTYEMPQESTEAEKKLAAKKTQIRGQVNLSLNPEDLENLDATTLKRKYEQQLQAEKKAKVAVRAEVEEAIEEQRQKKRAKSAAAGKGKDKEGKKFKF